MSYLLNKINSIREFNTDISMRGNSITNLKNPVAPADASTKEYVDSCIAMQASQIPQALADPIDETHLSNKRYVDQVVNDAKTTIDNQLLSSTRTTEVRLMEMRDSLATAADAVITLQSTAATTSERLTALNSTATTTSAAVTAAAAVRRYVKSHVGLVPILITTNNKSGFTITSSSYTETPVANLFIPYVATKTWMPTVDSSLGAEAWMKISCPFIVRLHSFHVAGIHSETVKKRHSLTLTGSNGVRVEGSTTDIEYTIFHTDNALLNKDVSKFDIETTESYSIYKLKIFSPEIVRPGLSYWQLFEVYPVV